MPKVTIKALQARIATLEELREYDTKKEASNRAEIEYHKQEIARLKTAGANLENDKRWLKTLIQNLSVPSQERTRF